MSMTFDEKMILAIRIYNPHILYMSKSFKYFEFFYLENWLANYFPEED